jgi:hypothetical protein
VLLDASDIKLSPDVWSAVCEEIEDCVAFNDRGYLKSFPKNESVDSYVSTKKCGEHGRARVSETTDDALYRVHMCAYLRTPRHCPVSN